MISTVILDSWAVPSYHVAHECSKWWAPDVLHVICTRLNPGHLSSCIGDSSWHSEEIVQNLELHLSMQLLLCRVIHERHMTIESYTNRITQNSVPWATLPAVISVTCHCRTQLEIYDTYTGLPAELNICNKYFVMYLDAPTELNKYNIHKVTLTELKICDTDLGEKTDLSI